MALSENNYIELINYILNNGEKRIGRNGNTLSIFGGRSEYDISNSKFPLLTTKRVFFRGIVEELLWFLRGSTNAKELQDKNIHIWDGNTSREFLDSVGLSKLEEGLLGPGYGYQWRSFMGNYPLFNGCDQLKYIIKELIVNPNGRRTILSAWNPAQLSEMALPPCHISYQFYIDNNNSLSCQMYMRSCDVAAGLPFNIASTALFTIIIAHVLKLNTKKIIIVSGDTHLYEEHIENAKIQITRPSLDPPTLKINKICDIEISVDNIDSIIKWIESLKYEDFELMNYNNHGTLSYKMVV